MTLISYKKTWGFSKVPIIASAIVVALLPVIFNPTLVHDSLIALVVYALSLAGFARFLIGVASRFAHEVYDCGEHLLIRKFGEEDRLPFSNITTVTSSNWEDGPVVTLHLEKPGKFGGIVKFFAVMPDLYSFTRDELAKDLAARAAKTRSGADR